MQKHDNWRHDILAGWNHRTMKLKLGLLIILLAATVARAQTNDLTALLQQGLFEEQANRNLDAAIVNYQMLAAQFDKDRQLAATGVFRLGECYRAEGKTNEAAAQYQRILSDFPDQTTLATLSRQDLMGMGMATSQPRFGAQSKSPEQQVMELEARRAGAGGNLMSLGEASDAEDQEIARIRKMIQNSPDLINAPDDHGHTPLENAAINGLPKVAAFLLDHGADVNAGKFSALNLAANAGNRAMVEFLLSHGADIGTKAWTGETPLHTAASEGYQAVTEALLANKADVNALDDNQETPLFLAVRNGHAKIVQRLLAAGTNPNLADKDGRTPLSVAAELGSSEMVKILLAAKADANGGTLDAPLLCAIDKHDLVSAELLLQAGADPNAEGQMHSPQGSFGYRQSVLRSVTPLWLAIDTHQFPMVQLLLRYKSNPNDSQFDNKPVIFWSFSDSNILQALLDAGANPNAEQGDDFPLSTAIYQNIVPAVQILLQHGANPNQTNRNGNVPLDFAVASEHFDPAVFQSLLDAGANPNRRDRDGQTPLQVIERVASGDLTFSSGNTPPPVRQRTLASSIADILRRHGALENPPDWSRITISRPGVITSATVFQRSTNDWNHFTLLELLLRVYPNPGWHEFSDELTRFPDLGRIVIERPSADGKALKRIPVNLLDGTNGVDCARDLPLEFGDVVKIPERGHNLAEGVAYLTGEQYMSMLNYFRSQLREVKLVVSGAQSISLQLQPMFSQIGEVLHRADARAALTSDSDLSRVKVTRVDSKTGEKREWILDCASAVENGNINSAPDLWLRNGDVVEVPEKQ